MGGGFSSDKGETIKGYEYDPMEDIIGRGHTSCIYKAKLKDEGRLAMDKKTPIPSIVALKIIDINTASRHKDPEIINECDVLAQILHRNAVKLYENFTIGDRMYLIMEYIAGGDLQSYVDTHGPLTESDAAAVMVQISSLVSIMAVKRIVFRDICAENILLTCNDDIEIRLINFGITAREFEEDSAKMLGTVCGSPQYVAPEVLMRAYDSKADVWSMGVLLYYLLSGRYPFRVEDMYGRYKNLKSEKQVSFNAPCWNAISGEAKNLIKKLLVENPNQRIRACDIMNHPWIIRQNMNLGNYSSKRESGFSIGPECSEMTNPSDFLECT